jgi:methylenetetrahydrofolate dehydrogenase (NADP+)/methenyltetrahydrofolate cyclohydrolase
VRTADVVVSAAGAPGLVQARDVRPGAVVVDVGTTEVGERLRGDVEPAVSAVASAYAPVPGGVGPVTVSYLLLNALEVVGA